MISICIALVALLCVVSCFFSVGILCNYLQVVLARLLTNIDNYILSHNVYVLLLLMFGEALEGQRPSLSSISVPLPIYLYNTYCSRQLSQLRNKSHTSHIVILSY